MLRSLVFAAAAALVGVANAQLPTPQEPPGFTVGGGSADAGVQLETYIDLMCPASKSAYPGLDKLVKHYKPSELRVKFVLFPLPYHQHAFTAAESAFTITSALGDDHFTKWLETVYENQESYWNKQTKDLTSVQVTKKFHELAKKTFPDLTDEQWEKGMTGYGGTDADSDARVSWKYTCTRTMSGTPMYTLNGVPFDAANSEWDFDDWFKVIDPLVQANKKKQSDERLAVTQEEEEAMRTMLRAAAVAISALLCAVSAQLPIPGKPPGFTVGLGSADAGVQLEAFVDLLCPDSRSAYPGLKKLAEHYESQQFRVKFVLFPLPYHQHAFAAAEAAFTITSALGDDQFAPWLETVYANQDIFWNKQTKDLTPVQVTKKLHALAKKAFPVLTDEQWEKGMTGYGGTDADERTREAWKYACSRGKSGTPLYNLNGVPFDADATWSFDDWLKVIDPLVKANEPVVNEVALSATTGNSRVVGLSGVPAVPDRNVIHFAAASGNTLSAASVCVGVAGGVRPCEFVPGRAMCCGSHEACVLRAGCVALE